MIKAVAETGNEKYYAKVEEYLKYLFQRASIDVISKNIPQNIIEDLLPQNLFINIPPYNCPDCSHCKLSKQCLTKGHFQLQKLLAESSNKDLKQDFDYKI